MKKTYSTPTLTAHDTVVRVTLGNIHASGEPLAPPQDKLL
jgi:hypothetical protein